MTYASSSLSIQSTNTMTLTNTCNSTITQLNTANAAAMTMSPESATYAAQTANFGVTVNSLLTSNLQFQAMMIKKKISGTPETVLSPLFVPGTLNTVGDQAKAEVSLIETMKTDITTACQQFVDLKSSSGANCAAFKCPTVDRCTKITDGWTLTSIYLNSFASSTSTKKLVSAIPAAIFKQALNSTTETNTLARNMMDCVKCMNTGFTKNQLVKPKCTAAPILPCKQKSAEKRKMNIDGARKAKKRMNKRKRDAKRGAFVAQWKGTSGVLLAMGANAKKNATAIALPNAEAKGESKCAGLESEIIFRFFNLMLKISSKLRSLMTDLDQNSLDLNQKSLIKVDLYLERFECFQFV